MDSAPEDPFAALKGVAARLDVEIPNAANCLEGLRTSSATASATKVSEQATVREAELKLIELRLEKIVKEKSVSIQQLTECLKQTDCDNKETLQKLLPLGFKVPDHLLPAVENLVLQSYQATVREAADDTLEDSPCSLAKVVKKLEPAFSKVATSSSQCCKPSQVSSHLPKQLQLPGSTKTASQSQPRNFPVGSRLHMYVEEIGNDDTLTFMNHKASVSRETAKPAVSSGMPDKDSAQSVHKEQEPSPGFPSLKQSLSNITFITGIQPLPRTPEVTGSQTRQEGHQETPKRKDWKFNKSVMATPKAPDCEETVMKFKEYKAAASKTPELRESPTPEQKENVGLRW